MDSHYRPYSPGIYFGYRYRTYPAGSYFGNHLCRNGICSQESRWFRSLDTLQARKFLVEARTCAQVNIVTIRVRISARRIPVFPYP